MRLTPNNIDIILEYYHVSSLQKFIRFFQTFRYIINDSLILMTDTYPRIKLDIYILRSNPDIIFHSQYKVDAFLLESGYQDLKYIVNERCEKYVIYGILIGYKNMFHKLCSNKSIDFLFSKILESNSFQNLIHSTYVKHKDLEKKALKSCQKRYFTELFWIK